MAKVSNYARVALTSVAGPLPLPREGFARRVAAALRLLGGRGTVGIVIVDDRAIRRINRDFLGHDFATDVVTFPLDSATARRSSVIRARSSAIGHRSSIVGELYLSLTTARREARARGIPVGEELLRYAVHGLLHLHGYDDRTARESQRMWRRQERILAEVLNPRSGGLPGVRDPEDARG